MKYLEFVKLFQSVSLAGSFAIFIILLYRLFISPLMCSSCIYEVSCSKYSIQVFNEKPFLKAVVLTFKRLISCNPWNN